MTARALRFPRDIRRRRGGRSADAGRLSRILVVGIREYTFRNDSSAVRAFQRFLNSSRTYLTNTRTKSVERYLYWFLSRTITLGPVFFFVFFCSRTIARLRANDFRPFRTSLVRNNRSTRSSLSCLLISTCRVFAFPPTERTERQRAPRRVTTCPTPKPFGVPP